VLDPDGSVVDRYDVGFGPGGLALDEARGRLYVLNQLDATLSTVTLADRSVRSLPLAYNPAPAEVMTGRPFLYDAALSSASGEQACASCHAFADRDGLAWDLGNPAGEVVRMPFDLTHDNFILKPRDFRFHPQKGPMMTQSLRGLDGVGPMHWRGDRFAPEGEAPTALGNFQQFRMAFKDLLGRDAPIGVEEMDAFGRFVLTLRYPPNPLENLDRTPSSSTDPSSPTAASPTARAATRCRSARTGSSTSRATAAARTSRPRSCAACTKRSAASTRPARR
jgi:hypothetical protein